MEQRELGSTGIKVSRIILGCGNFGGIGSAPEFFGQGESEAEAVALLDAAWDSGITTLDTADAYGGGRSEAYIGRWLAKQGARVRDDVVVATKLHHSVEGNPTDFGLAPERVARCIEASRERLGLERIPLYLTHQPDPSTPIDATLSELARQVERGAVGAVGASNIGAEELRVALAASRQIGLDEYAWVQNSYSLLDRGDERELLPLCRTEDLGYTPFGPLAGGWLSGKYTAGGDYPAGSRMTLRPEPYNDLKNRSTFTTLERFKELADAHAVSMATLAFAWLLANPDVSAIVVGPRRPEHLRPAIDALELELSADAVSQLDALFSGHTGDA
jgi:aryl-alcohol dehydrogenase-like predicted oxidoreductase